MKTMIILFCIVFLILFITYPFKITWKFHVNLLENIGFVTFKVFFIVLLSERFKISRAGKIQIERENQKNDQDNIFLLKYIESLALRVDVKRIDMLCDVGADNDAYFVSLFCGYIGALLSCVFSFFLNKYNDLKIFDYYIPCYEKSRLEFTGKVLVAFSLIDVFISLFVALKYYIKNKKEKKA